MIAIIRPRVRNLRGLSMIIYKATNLVNGKVYVGQTVNTLKYRKEQHWREAICPSRKNVHFHNALLKYGIDNFEFEIIDRARDVDELNKKESYWIDYYNSTDSRYGYNKDSGGKSGGFKSQETKEKIKDAVLMFVTAPDADTLKERLTGRGTETGDVIAARLSRACEEARGIENYDYLVVNDTVEHASELIDTLISDERNGNASDNEAYRVSANIDFINQIREDLKQFSKGE